MLGRKVSMVLVSTQKICWIRFKIELHPDESENEILVFMFLHILRNFTYWINAHFNIKLYFTI